MTLPDSATVRVASSVIDPELVRERHERLAEAAAYLYRRNGYYFTSVTEVAQRAGISVGSVYRYVRSKEDTLLLIMRMIMHRYERRVRPILQEPLPPQTKLARFIEGYLRHIDRERDGVMVMYRDAHVLGRQVRSDLEETDRVIIRDIRGIIHEGIETGAFRTENPDMVAHNVIAISHVWVLRRWRFPANLTVSEYVRTQVPLIMAQLGVREPAPGFGEGPPGGNEPHSEHAGSAADSRQ